ncbi:hypothetical protein FQN55_002999 [Onygenales sp. PD_40]|nr:hypothetical protein FQN55_002999 [Onygenales sp. PD_40]
MAPAGGNAKGRKAKDKENKKQKGKAGKKGNKAQKQEDPPETQASPKPSPKPSPKASPLPSPQPSPKISPKTSPIIEPEELPQRPPSIIESLPPLPGSVDSTPSVTPLSFTPGGLESPQVPIATLHQAEVDDGDRNEDDDKAVDNDNNNAKDIDSGNDKGNTEDPSNEDDKGEAQDPNNEDDKDETQDPNNGDDKDNAQDNNEDDVNGGESEEPRVPSAPSPASVASSAGPATPAATLSTNPFEVQRSTDKGLQDVAATPASPVPVRYPTPSAAHIPLPSPSLSEVRPRPTPPPSYHHYPHASSSPAPIGSPHYAFASPVLNPYAHAMIPPNAPLVDSHNMAVASPNYHTPLRSSAMDSPYSPFHHTKRASRTSFSRGFADQYYNPGYNSGYGPVKEAGPVQPPVVENGKSSSNAEGVSVSLLQRIQSVIPDIGQLVDSYRETQTQLSAREAEHKQIEAQHEQSLMQKEFYIDALQDQLQKNAKEKLEQCTKLKGRINELRLEIGDLQEKHSDTAETLAEVQKENEELTQTREELQREIESLQRAVEEEKAAHAQELEQQKENEKEALDNQKQELEGYFQEIKDADDKLAAEQLQAREKELMDERDALKAEWESEKQELEDAKSALITDYEGKLESKQADIDAKQGELDAKQAALEAKQAELEAKQAELDATQAELEARKADLEAKTAECESKQGELETKQGELDAKQGELDGKEAEVKAKEGEIETMRGELDTKQGELDAKQSELEAKLAELEGKKTELEEKQAELTVKQSELETIQGELTDKKSELESKQTELEAKQGELDAKQAELDETKKICADEVAALNDTHEKERSAAAQEAEEKINNLITEYQQKEEAWQKTREDLEAQLLQRVEELKQAGEEKEVLAKEGLAKEEQLRSVVDEMRQTHENLSKDRERLKKTLHSLGEATDMKIKGDDFFLKCFSELSRLIVNLSKEHFGYLPIDPPSDIIAKIPSEIPQFLDNTQASRELRSAYVQHVISKTLTYRIFQPFLFTLGRRYDKADTFFQMLSMDIRRKSVRREAYWRQQTLKAAYTTSDAKQAINVVAAVIVDEIIDHIRHFADPSNLDALLVGVRKIVKTAAETWRLARVERELIIAAMPSAEDEQTQNEGWKEFNYESLPPTPPADGPGSVRRRTVLLRMCPRIYREPVHEDFTEDGEMGAQCVYLPGVVLYADSPAVVARKMEIAKKTNDSSGSGSGTPVVVPVAAGEPGPAVEAFLDEPADGADKGGEATADPPAEAVAAE